MMDGSIKAASCEDEVIHIPGSIQPHGVMLVAARDGLAIWQAGGAVTEWLGQAEWCGAPLTSLIGPDLAGRVAQIAVGRRTGALQAGYVGQMRNRAGLLLDVSAHAAMTTGAGAAQAVVVIELEPAAEHGHSAALVLDRLETASIEFQRSTTLDMLCRAAAIVFRQLTGYDRVMVYRFGDDEAGRVIAEDKRDDLRSFLNHHFPATDIPAQARALYVRNLVRVIPDIHYTPAPLLPPIEGATLDMSDASLRSVSPTHLQYLFNMGVRASASFSIVKDGVLWGLIACHNAEPRGIPYDMRVACRAVAANLSREIKSKEEAEGYRQRLRLRSFEDDVTRLMSREGPLDEMLLNHFAEVQQLMSADGVAVLRQSELLTAGTCPSRREIRALAQWVLQNGGPVLATDRLGEPYPPAVEFRAEASGILGLVLSVDEPWLVLWFRAEQIQTLNWAGNPHSKDGEAAVEERLTPRASFDLWAETVRGQSRRWTLAEQQSAARLRAALLEVRQTRRVQELNRRLTTILADKDLLLQQKEFLMGEVNHRVQNSLQLVASFLAMQARNSDNSETVAALDEARRRLAAVGLVHRRLYRGDQIEMINAARYIEELCTDALSSMGQEWQAHLALDLAPVMISTDRAVTLGLVLTELMINVNKYAYGGEAGPVSVRLVEDRASFQLIVADRGIGRQSARKGFGSRMMTALVQQLGGELIYEDNDPGLKAVLSAAAESPKCETRQAMQPATGAHD